MKTASSAMAYGTDIELSETELSSVDDVIQKIALYFFVYSYLYKVT